MSGDSSPVLCSTFLPGRGRRESQTGRWKRGSGSHIAKPLHGDEGSSGIAVLYYGEQCCLWEDSRYTQWVNVCLYQMFQQTKRPIMLSCICRQRGLWAAWEGMAEEHQDALGGQVHASPLPWWVVGVHPCQTWKLYLLYMSIFLLLIIPQ